MGSRARLCVVAPKAYPLFNQAVEAVFGGAEVDLYYVATELAKDSNFDVTAVVADYGQPDVESRDGVRIIKGLDLGSCQLCNLFRLWLALKRADADIYLIKTISPGVPLLAAFCRIYKKAFLYRTSSGETYDRCYLRQHRLAGMAFRWAIRNADLVLAQTRQAAMFFKENLCSKGVQIIPNAHRLGPFVQTARRYVLWVGRSDCIKQPELFLRLAQCMPDQQFAMVCQQATGDRDYQAFVKSARLLPNLEFTERVAFDKITSYFQQAKVLVNTSQTEGFPNTFIHAFACGVPVVSLTVDPDGILGKAGYGLCADGSFDRLVGQVRYMLEGQRYIDMGINARAYVEKNHDISRVIGIYKGIFYSIKARPYVRHRRL